MVERATLTRQVAGSSPAPAATLEWILTTTIHDVRLLSWSVVGALSAVFCVTHDLDIPDVVALCAVNSIYREAVWLLPAALQVLCFLAEFRKRFKG